MHYYQEGKCDSTGSAWRAGPGRGTMVEQWATVRDGSISLMNGLTKKT